MGAPLDTGNMGVSALSASLIKIIKTLYPDANISFFIGNKTSNPQKIIFSGEKIEIDVINYRLSPRSKISEHLLWIFLMACLYWITPFQKTKERIVNSNWRLKALKEADFVCDIRGGDSFSDIYGLNRFLSGALSQICVLLLGNKYILLPQTYGPYRSKLAQHLAILILKRAYRILSRDKNSIKTINSLLRDKALGSKIFFCPDVAFLLVAIRPEQLKVEPPISKIAKPVVGFNINGLLYNGGYTRNNMFRLKYDYKAFTHQIIRRILEETTSHIVLIPHTFAPKGHVESDNDACNEVFNNLSLDFEDRLHFVNAVYDQFEIKSIIGMCDFFIGSRMHACIAALSQGIPTIGVAYSQKFKGVFDSIDAGDLVIDATSLDMDTSMDLISRHLKRYKTLRRSTLEKANNAIATIQNTFDNILKLDP